MNADTILAEPNTITGSIGVTGGWFYNKELKNKLGLSTDLAKSGRHADVGFGFTLPLLGIGLPDRNLNDDEREKAERAIRAIYTDFVRKVAAGRGMSAERVDSLGQGRVWSGSDAKAAGLVDLLGGLDNALRVARERAGVPPWKPLEIVEMPSVGLINWPAIMPSPFGADEKTADAALDHVRFRLRHNGEPLPVMLLEDVEFEPR
jgi:protease-4